MKKKIDWRGFRGFVACFVPLALYFLLGLVVLFLGDVWFPFADGVTLTLWVDLLYLVFGFGFLWKFCPGRISDLCRRLSFRESWEVVSVGILFTALMQVLVNVWVLLYPDPKFTETSQDTFSQVSVLMLFTVCVVGPFCEEFLFRFLIYGRLRTVRDNITAVVISSLLFSFLHGNLVQGVLLFFLGVFCCYWQEKRGFFGAVLFHMSFNLVPAVISIMR